MTRQDENRDKLPALPLDVYAHCFETDDVWVGGVLVGRLLGRARPPAITASLRVPESSSPLPLDLVGDEAWARVNAAVQQDFPGQEIVGWYCSYPGAGLDVLDEDVRLHEQRFPRSGQLLAVIDPKLRQEAIFGWHGQDLAELIRRDCTYPTVQLRPRTQTGLIASAPDGMPMFFGLVELNPRTTRPTAAATVYLLITLFAVLVFIWAALFR
jgi:proteasome lid subunit RPN8/RPN11